MNTCSFVKYLAGVVALFCIILLALHTANVIVFTGFNQQETANNNTTVPPEKEDVVPPVPYKTIFMWNGDWSHWSAFGAGREAFIEAKCPITVGTHYSFRMPALI